MTRQRRDRFFHVGNKAQEKILYPFYVACLLLLFSFIALARIFWQPFIGPSGNSTDLLNLQQLNELQTEVLIFGGIFAIIFFTLIFWAFSISHQILGPYERVLRELDEIIIGKKVTPLRTRREDFMFAEIVKRINLLVEARAKKS